MSELSRILVATLAVAVPFGLPASPAAAQEGSGTECCRLLVVPVGARASSLGGSITARSGVEAVFRNPAGLAGLDGSTFVVHHSDINVNTQVDAFSLVLTPRAFGLGFSYQLFDNGEIRTTDASGNDTGELVLRDHLVVASLATRVTTGLSAGLSYRLFQQRIDCNGQCGGEESVGTTNSIDAGLRYQPLWHPALELGLSLVNVGPGLKVVDAAPADPLPGRIHVGAAYDVLQLLAATRDEDRVALRVTTDVQDVLREPGTPTIAMGMELDVQQAVFLRAGYAPGEGLGTGAAVGLELRYDRFDIAVARSFVNSQLGTDSEPFQISFGLNF